MTTPAVTHINQDGSVEDSNGQTWPSYGDFLTYYNGASMNTAANPPLGSAAPPTANGRVTGALNNVNGAIQGGSQDAYDQAIGELLGVFQGNTPTLPLRNTEEKAREANLSDQLNLVDTASKMNGPANYGDFLAYTGAGKNVANQLLSGRPASSAPTSTITPMSLPQLMQQMGLMTPQYGGTPTGTAGTPDPFAGVPGGGPMQKVAPTGGGGSGQNADTSDPLMGMDMSELGKTVWQAVLHHISHKSQQATGGGGGSNPWGDNSDYGGADPLSNTYTLRAMGLQGQDPTGSLELSNPGGNIDPAKWDQLGKAGQQFFLAGAQKYGWDPNTFLEQIEAQRPQGSAYLPNSTATAFAPMGLAA